MSNSSVLEEMIEFTNKVKNGEHENVKPGQPTAFTEASTPNDCIWQGDLALVISTKNPKMDDKFTLAEKATNKLVPGDNEGSRHCLESLDGVQVYVPKDWNEESLVGPILVLDKANTITHPIHGNVSIPAGFTVECHYQREWDKEMAKERRARD